MQTFPKAIIIITAGFSLYAATCFAGPFDQLKNLKFEPKGILQPASHSVEFEFGAFTLTPATGDAPRTWTLELKISQAIAVNTYMVKNSLKNRQGDLLSSGDDIALPAGEPGRSYTLSRSFRAGAEAASLVVSVYNRLEESVVTSRSYPVAGADVQSLQNPFAPGRGSVPRPSQESAARIDATLDYTFVLGELNPESSEHSFQLQNKSTFPLKLNEKIVGTAGFLVGAPQGFDVSYPSSEIKPGQSVTFKFHGYVSCPTLTSLEFRGKLNGNDFRHQIKVDSPIKAIDRLPVVRLSKEKEGSGGYGNGSGTAEVVIRGSYVKPGGEVTLKALASVDSDRFPVVFSGRQRDDGIHATVEIVGTHHLQAPDQFCFNLTEVLTCDSPMCGGVGILLYRDEYDQSEWIDSRAPNRNYFLNRKVCK